MNYVEAATLIEPAPAEQPEIAKHFLIATHNGFITAKNARTGDHRTFRIHTQASDAKFAPNMRVVSLLIGQDNEHDYKGFGFVIGNQVQLWSRYRDSKAHLWFRSFLQTPERYPHIEVNFEGRCRKCDRLLTEPMSVKLGIGPTCRAKSY